MTVKEQIPIILSVIKDWRVIVTTVAMILVIAFVNFITNYKEKKKKPAPVKKAAAPSPAPAEKAPENGEKKADISEKDV